MKEEPSLGEGGIDAFFRREVLPHVPDAWIDESTTQIAYEVSCTRHFYKPTPLRSPEEIKADLEALQIEGEGLLDRLNDSTPRTPRPGPAKCARVMLRGNTFDKVRQPFTGDGLAAVVVHPAALLAARVETIKTLASACPGGKGGKGDRK